jgi:ERCC4-type nuclease
MSDSSFEGWNINEDDINENPSETLESTDVKPVLCPFTVRVDTREQMPYQFDNIIGDYRDDYAPLIVQTNRKKVLPAGDYAIEGLVGIAIERKSKSDLFQSVATGQKRENFIGRLHKMKEGLLYGAVVIECYPEEIYEDPPEYTSLSPKTVFRTSLSWAIQFPNVHWHWCRDREKAEQTTFRLLEKFYEHHTNKKYVAHNKPIDSCMEAYNLGIISRMSAKEFQAPYCVGNDLRIWWEKGWNWFSTHFLNGDLGAIYEVGQVAPSEVAAALAAHKAKKGKSDKIIPLPGQRSFLEQDNSEDGLSEIVDQIEKSINNHGKTRKKKA